MLSIKFFKFHAGIMGEKTKMEQEAKKQGIKRGGGNMKLGFSSL